AHICALEDSEEHWRIAEKLETASILEIIFIEPTHFQKRFLNGQLARLQQMDFWCELVAGVVFCPSVL
ncbi:hypothetical protein FF38_07525, partial [Lucilia cuprina]